MILSNQVLDWPSFDWLRGPKRLDLIGWERYLASINFKPHISSSQWCWIFIKTQSETFKATWYEACSPRISYPRARSSSENAKRRSKRWHENDTISKVWTFWVSHNYFSDKILTVIFRESVYRKYLFYKNFGDFVEVIIFVQNPISWSFAASKSTTNCEIFLKHLDQYLWMMKFYDDFLNNSKDSFVLRVEDLAGFSNWWYQLGL